MSQLSIASKATRKFTGREKYKIVFLDKLITPQAKDEYRLLTFYGVGGQGKSALFDYLQDTGPLDQNGQRFNDIVKQKDDSFEYKIASVDFKTIRYQQSQKALMKLRIDLIGTGIDFLNLI